MIKTTRMTAMVLGLSLATNAFTCSIDGKDGFLPENNLRIPVGVKSENMTEAEFNTAIDNVENIYKPIIASMGAKLVVERKWSDATVNAYAQQSGNIWKVSMFGGLARHKTITQDAMSLVVCHEVGHHIGGAPKIGQTPGGDGGGGGGWWGGGRAGSQGLNQWASNEGQSDYFATTKCLRKSWLNDDNSAIVAKMQVPASVTEKCAKSTRNDKEDTALCVRMAMAGKSVGELFASLAKSPEVKFETPDTKVVTATNDRHPAAQCRLDTYFSGALCDVSHNEDVSQTDEVKGTCHGSLGHTVGTRPLCWFKPSKK